MEFVNGLKQALDLVARLVEIVLQDLSRLVAALNLRLKILDSAVDVADATGFGRASLLEILKLLFKLHVR